MQDVKKFYMQFFKGEIGYCCMNVLLVDLDTWSSVFIISMNVLLCAVFLDATVHKTCYIEAVIQLLFKL